MVCEIVTPVVEAQPDIIVTLVRRVQALEQWIQHIEYEEA